METDDSRGALARQLHEIERGEAAPWVSYPPMAWWWPVAFGVWAGTYVLTFELDGVLKSLLQVLHVALALGAVWWWRRIRGTYPTDKSPRELRGPFALLFGGTGLVVLVIWGCYVLLSPWVAAGVGGVLAWALISAYERSYGRAAARVRERLA